MAAYERDPLNLFFLAGATPLSMQGPIQESYVAHQAESLFGLDEADRAGEVKALPTKTCK